MSVQGSSGPPRWRRALAAAVAVSVAGLAAPFVAIEPAAAETVRDAQWFLRSLKIDQVHKITKGAGVTVAVVDTGIEADHPDLKGQVTGGTTPGGAAGGAMVDDDAHGTAMAGLIAAKGGGANNALGIAPAAKLLSVRLSGTTKGVNTDEIAPGIRWAVDNGAKVINLSLGDQAKSIPAEVDAVNYALSKDVVVVAAAGNRGQGVSEIVTPANLPGVVAVGSTGKDGSVHSQSVSGAALGIVAPGEQMVTTGSRRAGNSSGYVMPTGTSPAAAVVSGVVALIRSKFPSLSAADVVNRLVHTADDMGPAGRDPESGFGEVDPLRALTENVANTGVNPLGQSSAVPSGQAAGSAPGDYDIRPRSWWQTRFEMVLGGFAVLVILVIAAVVLLRVRSSRRRRAAGGAWGPPGSGPPPPGGWPGPPGPSGPPGSLGPGGWPGQAPPSAQFGQPAQSGSPWRPEHPGHPGQSGPPTQSGQPGAGPQSGWAAPPTQSGQSGSRPQSGESGQAAQSGWAAPPSQTGGWAAPPTGGWADPRTGGQAPPDR